MKKIIISLFALGTCMAAGAQNLPELSNDARSMGMGNSGVALTPSGMSIHTNVAAIGLSEDNGAVTIGYSPWMHDKFSGNNIYSLGSFYRINGKHSVSLGARYFNRRNVHITDRVDENGTALPDWDGKPWEMTVEAGYTYTINPTMAVGAVVRYMNSELDYEGLDAANAFGFDLGYYFRKDRISAGFVLSNVGTKLDYNGSEDVDMPAWVRAGGAYALPLGSMHQLTGTLQLDYKFIDADDMEGFGAGVGVEYMYNNMLAARIGYRLAEETRDFNYFTAGIGVNVKCVDFNFSMIFGDKDDSWKNTMLFGLGVRF